MEPNDHGRDVAAKAKCTTDQVDQSEIRTQQSHQLHPMQDAERQPSDGQTPLNAELQVGHYKLLAKLGQGGMGAVYKALHTKLGKLVALKLLPAERMQDPEAVARFEREMRAIGKLAHENIVVAHDAGEIDGTHYLVMELVEGADVGSIARDQGPLQVAEACEIIRQAALGLQHAYDNNLVHRDIKPSNLMLADGPNGPVVKILDLGLARLGEQQSQQRDLTASGQIMGTLDYMAPEQAGDTHAVDIRADIYSLGATLYKLLTGRVPFQGDQYTNAMRKLVALATQEPPRIDSFCENLPAELVQIVHRMMARQPEDRYETPQQIAEAMAPFAASANLAALLEKTKADGTDSARTVVKTAASVNVRSSAVDTKPQFAPELALQPVLRPSGSATPPRRFKPRVLVACAALPAALLLGVILLSLRTPHGEIVVELADGIPADAAKNLKIEVSGNGEVKIADAAAGWTIDLAEGKYQASLAGGGDQFQLEQNQVTVTRGEKTLLKVLLKPPSQTPAREQHADSGVAAATTTGKSWQPTREQQAFFDRVATLPPEEQAMAVAEKLKAINPGFDGKADYTIEGGQVAFRCRSQYLAEIWPVRALSHLQDLRCPGESADRRSQFKDLSPLQGLKLTSLHFPYSVVSDLSPLRGMPLKQLGMHNSMVEDLTPLAGMALEELNCDETPLRDLAPLKGMPLKILLCGRTQIRDLSPIEGMPLAILRCDRTAIADLSPLRGMKLWELSIYRTNISDLSPLAGMPLRKLFCDVRLFDEADEDVLRSLPLRWVNGELENGRPIQQFFEELAQRRKAAESFAEETSQFPAGDRLAAVQAKLHALNGAGQVRLSSKLEEQRLDEAEVFLAGKVADLTPLMALTELRKLALHNCLPWQDLSCLKFLPLEELACSNDALYKNQNTLRGISTMHTINGMPAESFWAELLKE
jgi:serine/threonine protein kinase